MSEIDVKNTLEQMWREGFNKCFQVGCMHCMPGGQPPEVTFRWNGRTPMITLNRPRGGGLYLPDRRN